MCGVCGVCLLISYYCTELNTELDLRSHYFVLFFLDTHVCLAGQFKCTKNKKCIPVNLRCNGQDDCGDEEDEKDCRKSLRCLA